MDRHIGEPPDPAITEIFELGKADYEKAIRFARTPDQRTSLELDLAYLNGNWRGMTDRMEKLLEHKDCFSGLWYAAISLPYGYADRLNPMLEELVACDPLTIANWQKLASTRIWGLDPDGVLEVTRRGLAVVDSDTLVAQQAVGLMLKGQNEQAQIELDTRIRSADSTKTYLVMIAAALGQREKAESLFEEYRGSQGESKFNTLSMYAWTGDRENANRLAANLDQHPFGYIALSIAVLHCNCGEPWDLSATPVFAAKIKESGLSWPPVSPLTFPFKDW